METNQLENRIGVIGIVVEDIEETGKINEVLHVHANIIVGRMGRFTTFVYPMQS